MNDVMFTTIKYFGGEWCTADKDVLKKVRDMLKEAKPNWMAMDYGTIEKYRPAGDVVAALYWNGAALRVARGESRREVRLSEGRLPTLDGQRRDPEGRQERRERQAVP